MFAAARRASSIVSTLAGSAYDLFSAFQTPPGMNLSQRGRD
jgi:hypothetical protein